MTSFLGLLASGGVGSTSAPGAPTSPIASSASATSVLLSWTAPADPGSSAITDYEYRIDAGSAVSVGLGLTESVTGLTTGTSYDFEVRAVNVVGAGAWSTVVSATPSSRAWFGANNPAELTPAAMTTGSGVVRNVASSADFIAARAAAGPGDVINVTAVIAGQNERNAVAEWDGRSDGSAAPSGTAANPIVITCTGVGEFRAPTTWNTSTEFPSQLDVIDVDHVHVIGIKGTGGQFGLRMISSGGSSGFPAKMWHNDISGVRDASILAGSLGGVGRGHQGFISIMYNTVHDAVGTVDFEEGVYIGTGATNFFWQDKTHDVEVAHNDISGVRGDGVDVKLGCYNIDVHHNSIHDIGAALGAGVTCGTTGSGMSANPDSYNPNVTIHHNWIWNIGFAFSSASNSSYGIIASLSGTQVYNNVIWGLDPTQDVNGIRVRLYVNDNSYPINVYNNTVWAKVGTNGAALVDIPGSFGPTTSFENNLTEDGTAGSTVVSASDFVGTIPAVNVSGTADNGDGPGSSFVPKATATTIVGAATGTIPADDITDLARPQGGASDRGAYEYI